MFHYAHVFSLSPFLLYSWNPILYLTSVYVIMHCLQLSDFPLICMTFLWFVWFVWIYNLNALKIKRWYLCTVSICIFETLGQNNNTCCLLRGEQLIFHRVLYRVARWVTCPFSRMHACIQCKTIILTLVLFRSCRPPC